MLENYDYHAQSTGDMTDYLCEHFSQDLEWGENLNGLPLYKLMMALGVLIDSDFTGTIYISNNGYIDEFFWSFKKPKAQKFVYEVTIDPKDSCMYYIKKIS